MSASSIVHIKVGSGTGGQLLIWFLELGYFLRWPPAEGRTEWSFPVGSVCTHGLFWLRFHVGLGQEA